jgi:hypothetical protein
MYNLCRLPLMFGIRVVEHCFIACKASSSYNTVPIALEQFPMPWDWM